RDYHARLAKQAEFEGEFWPPGCLDERAAVEELRDDDRHEARLAAGQRPDVLDHRVRPAVLRGQDLEVRVHLGELTEARPEAGVCVLAGDVDRVEGLAGDLSCVPDG